MTSRSLYPQVMGAAFDDLHPALQAFHTLAGRHELHGEVQIDAPSSAPARWLAWCLGTPTRGSRGPLRFTLDATPEREVWNRHFPSFQMRSQLRRVEQRVHEALGPARLSFELIAGPEGRLLMRLEALRFLGIPCPRRLMPRVLAQESGEADRLLFEVEASVPGIGTVTRYRGHLVIPAVDSP